jgi:hypothetical protein
MSGNAESFHTIAISFGITVDEFSKQIIFRAIPTACPPPASSVLHFEDFSATPRW